MISLCTFSCNSHDFLNEKFGLGPQYPLFFLISLLLTIHLGGFSRSMSSCISHSMCQRYFVRYSDIIIRIIITSDLQSQIKSIMLTYDVNILPPCIYLVCLKYTCFLQLYVQNTPTPHPLVLLQYTQRLCVVLWLVEDCIGARSPCITDTVKVNGLEWVELKHIFCLLLGVNGEKHVYAWDKQIEGKRNTELISLLNHQRRRNYRPRTDSKHERSHTQEVNRGSLVVSCVIILCSKLVCRCRVKVGAIIFAFQIIPLLF